jgi:hypothetical protein
MAGSTGLEPAASAVTGQRSNQLNYDPAFVYPGLAETSINIGDSAHSTPNGMPDRSSLVLHPNLIDCNRSALTMAVPLLRRLGRRMGDIPTPSRTGGGAQPDKAGADRSEPRVGLGNRHELDHRHHVCALNVVVGEELERENVAQAQRLEDDAAFTGSIVRQFILWPDIAASLCRPVLQCLTKLWRELPLP